MIVKRALLEREIESVKQFLLGNDLKYDQDITETYFVEEDGKIIATISRSAHLIKALAVGPEYRGENLGGLMVSEILNSMRLDRIYYHQVFTKKEYIEIFRNLGFRLISATDKVAVLEGGDGDIRAEINKMRSIIEHHFRIDLKKSDLGVIVVNCNPMTKGHYQLIVDSAKKHDYFLVLVVEEDQSAFTFE
ncbi:MAG: GNAT family N-acetyltransferase, partial [Bacilli bacterium]|nr:GNAT family N-acetyltransferase [Bacilli bacterium]